jgi:hypothetical protein
MGKQIDVPLTIMGDANDVYLDITTRLAVTVLTSFQKTLQTRQGATWVRPLEVAVGGKVTIVGSKNVVRNKANGSITETTEIRQNASSKENTGPRKRRAESVSTTPLNCREMTR